MRKERVTQNRIVQLFVDQLKYTYLGNLEDQENSNIRETTAHIKGESHLVWKWVGSSALSPLKKRLRIF
jgi:hypothetical protein